MRRLALRRLVSLPLVLLGMSLITFLLTHVVPGDPARLAAGPHASAEAVQTLREEYGLNDPLPIQYVTYMRDLAHGDLGTSISTRRPVLDDLAEFFPATAELTAVAMLLVVVVGLPLGLVAGMMKDRLPDFAIRIASVAAVSMPVFMLGIILQIIFYGRMGLLPAGGRIDTFIPPPATLTGSYVIDSVLRGDTAALQSALVHLVLPAVSLAAASMAVIVRMLRATVGEVRDSDHVRTAHAKGLPSHLVLRRHVFRNALIPVTTLLGLQVGVLLAGSVLVEVVFSWPGIGLYAVNAISNLDYSAIVGVTLLISAVYVVANLIVDLVYLVLDPRIADAAEAKV